VTYTKEYLSILVIKFLKETLNLTNLILILSHTHITLFIYLFIYLFIFVNEVEIKTWGKWRKPVICLEILLRHYFVAPKNIVNLAT
jgi:hypothetical protein